ncbi:MAG: hypothetical protein OXN86_00620 [Chloroflexota bacterium]|nr:hypothetical protein [Chloroflexota bacterium]
MAWEDVENAAAVVTMLSATAQLLEVARSLRRNRSERSVLETERPSSVAEERDLEAEAESSYRRAEVSFAQISALSGLIRSDLHRAPFSRVAIEAMMRIAHAVEKSETNRHWREKDERLHKTLGGPTSYIADLSAEFALNVLAAAEQDLQTIREFREAIVRVTEVDDDTKAGLMNSATVIQEQAEENLHRVNANVELTVISALREWGGMDDDAALDYGLDSLNQVFWYERQLAAHASHLKEIAEGDIAPDPLAAARLATFISQRAAIEVASAKWHLDIALVPIPERDDAQ